MTQIYEEFQKYRDQHGLNQLHTNDGKGVTTQNGALFTMEYLICLLHNDDFLANDLSVIEAEKERLRQVFKSLEALPGLTLRYPGDKEGDSMDNNGASLVFSALFGNRTFAETMYKHGREVECTGVDPVQDPEGNKKYYKAAKWVTALYRPVAALIDLVKYREVRPRYFWNNTRPTEFCIWGWYGRSPGFIALARYCATGKMNALQTAALWVGQFLGCFAKREDTDARKLPYVVWQVMKTKNRFWALSYRLWCFILMRQYANGMRDVYSMYYSDPNHPIRKYSKPYVA